MSTRTKFGKTVKVEQPYAPFTHAQGWEWRVLKPYHAAKKEKENQEAGWLGADKSPMTYGSWEYGDTYSREIKEYGTLESATQEWLMEYGI